MKMGLFKHRVLPLSIVSILLSSLSSSLLCVGISNFRDAYNETSVYENTQIDFMIPSPSKEQVENFKMSRLFPAFFHIITRRLMRLVMRKNKLIAFSFSTHFPTWGCRLITKSDASILARLTRTPCMSTMPFLHGRNAN